MTCFFTVFTPTFNRAATLPRLWESLDAQNFDDFEWLVIDDGSTDDTAGLIESLQRKSRFTIRYFHQENSGKHVAFDCAVDLAAGELFLPVDSDDVLLPHALRRFSDLWRAIPAADRGRFSGITAACCTPEGRFVGRPMNRPLMDCTALDAVFRWRLTGERFGFHRTDVLKRIRFPIGRELKFVPEGVLWLAIAREYVTRFVDEPLRVYFTDGIDRLSSSAKERRGPGLAFYCDDLMRNYCDYALIAPVKFFKAAVQYLRFQKLLFYHIAPRGAFPVIVWPFLTLAFAPAVILRLISRIASIVPKSSSGSDGLAPRH